MKEDNGLNSSIQMIYALGQLGWSTLVNIIGLQLVYFYIPPQNAGIPQFITGVTFLGVINAITLIAASGRFLDAITDPIVANLSDRSTHSKGRRIPFLCWGALPAALFCILIFFPPVLEISVWNIGWLLLIQALFYIALTIYVTPYFALLPEMANNSDERLNLSTWISITYALGIIVAAQVPMVANLLEDMLAIQKFRALQCAIALFSFIAMLLMYIPVIFIDEKKYCDSQPTSVPLFESLKQVLKNVHFRYYVIADFSYFTGLTIINTGLLYYITVLLLQEEALVGTLLTMMVVISFIFYPIVNILAKKIGKKILIVLSFLTMGGVFLFITFLGKMPIPVDLQGYLLAVLEAIPLAFLGVLPNAVLADIAEHSVLKTGQKQEGIYFATRTLMQKFGQTFGVLIFATLTTFGKDPGNDLGIRLSGIIGMFLCLIAGFIFSRYKEKRVLSEMKEFESELKL